MRRRRKGLIEELVGKSRDEIIKLVDNLKEILSFSLVFIDDLQLNLIIVLIFSFYFIRAREDGIEINQYEMKDELVYTGDTTFSILKSLFHLILDFYLEFHLIIKK